MTDMAPARAFVPAPAVETLASGVQGIGVVVEVTGSSSQIILDAGALAQLASSADASIAAAGQMGGQVKVRVGTHLLLANIRSLRLSDTHRDELIATVD
ncbi:MAG: ATPase, partial [Sphingomonas sp.]